MNSRKIKKNIIKYTTKNIDKINNYKNDIKNLNKHYTHIIYRIKSRIYNKNQTIIN